MPFIDPVKPSRAGGKLAELYGRFANPDGTVDAVLQIHGVNPGALQAHIDLYVQAMVRPSPLTRVEREIVGVTVSRINQCHY